MGSLNAMINFDNDVKLIVIIDLLCSESMRLAACAGLLPMAMCTSPGYKIF